MREVTIQKSNLDYINPDARVIIVGKTPGNTQMSIDISHLTPEEIKKERAFAGSMRKNISKMLDHIGLNEYLGIDTCISLWGNNYKLADFTSILKDAVYENGKMLNSIDERKLSKDPYKRLFEEGFVRDIPKYIKAEIWIGLGPDVERILNSLKDKKMMPDGVVIAIPHGSGANAGRINNFLGIGKIVNAADEWAIVKAEEARNMIECLNHK